MKDHQKQWSRGYVGRGYPRQPRGAAVRFQMCVCVCVLCRIGFVAFENVESAQLALSASEDDLTLDGR